LVAARIRPRVSKHLTGLAAIVEAKHPHDLAAAREAGRRLGWTDGWVETVLGDCLAAIPAWRGGPVRSLTSEVIDNFDDALDQTMQP
jgi:hypothetical protein